VTLLLTLAVPGPAIHAQRAIALIAAFAVVWGALMLSGVPWAHSPLRVSHVSTILSLAIVAALTRATGSTTAAALDYLWLVVVYAAFFYTPRQAVAYWLACVGIGIYLMGTRVFLFSSSRVPGVVRALLLVATFQLARLRPELSPYGYVWLLTGWMVMCAALSTRAEDVAKRVTFGFTLWERTPISHTSRGDAINRTG
jgi:hypothetical protein